MLCPTQLPLYEPKARDTGRLTVQTSRYRGRFFAIEFVYGIPPRFRTPHQVPFVHFVVNREVDADQQGGAPPPRAHSQGHRYVFTLHDLGDDTMELFGLLVGGLRPAT